MDLVLNDSWQSFVLKDFKSLYYQNLCMYYGFSLYLELSQSCQILALKATEGYLNYQKCTVQDFFFFNQCFIF